MKTNPLLSAAALSFCLLGSSLAAELFEVNIQSVGAARERSDRISSSNLPDLIRDLERSEGRFSIYANSGYDSWLNYAGYKNAIRYVMDPSGRSAYVEIPVLNFREDFRGSDRDDTEDQLRDYFKRKGKDLYKEFMKAMNRETLVAVSDGNPGATTALASTDVFMNNAFDSDTRLPGSTHSIAEGMYLGLLTDANFTDAGPFSGTTYGLAIQGRWKFTDRVRMRLDVPIRYTEIEGADIWNVGLITAFPILVVPAPLEHIYGGPAAAADPKNPKAVTPTQEILGSYKKGFEWQLTPSLGVLAGGSLDFAAGNVSFLGGLSSRLTYYTKHFSVSLGNQITMIEGFDIDIDGFETGGDVSQQILKNGVHFAVPITPTFGLEGYGIYTNFLQDAAVKDYWTVGGGVVWDFSGEGRRVLRLGVYSDFGDDYSSVGVRFGSGFQF